MFRKCLIQNISPALIVRSPLCLVLLRFFSFYSRDGLNSLHFSLVTDSLNYLRSDNVKMDSVMLKITNYSLRIFQIYHYSRDSFNFLILTDSLKYQTSLSLIHCLLNMFKKDILNKLWNKC
jgi:hypothetical protein